MSGAVMNDISLPEEPRTTTWRFIAPSHEGASCSREIHSLSKTSTDCRQLSYGTHQKKCVAQLSGHKFILFEAHHIDALKNFRYHSSRIDPQP
jgi:hypothetical protein